MEATLEADAAQLRDRVKDFAESFAPAAETALRSSLRAAMEQFVRAHSEWFDSLDDETAASLHRAADDAIDRGAAEVANSLRDVSMWLSPSVILEEFEEHQVLVYDLPFPVIVPTDIKRVGEWRHPGPDDALDSPRNRAWVTLLNGADRLDGVLLEFGLTPSEQPDPGGGHFGLQPRTARALDPSGNLEHLWREYRQLFHDIADVHERLAREIAQEREADALERWRKTGEES